MYLFSFFLLADVSASYPSMLDNGSEQTFRGLIPLEPSCLSVKMTSLAFRSYRVHILVCRRPSLRRLVHSDSGTSSAIGKLVQRKWFVIYPCMLQMILTGPIVCRDQCCHDSDPTLGYDRDMDRQVRVSCHYVYWCGGLVKHRVLL